MALADLEQIAERKYGSDTIRAVKYIIATLPSLSADEQERQERELRRAMRSEDIDEAEQEIQLQALILKKKGSQS